MGGFVLHCGYCGKTQVNCTCGTTPAEPAPKRSRIVERYGERFCAVCGFGEAACGCDRVADTPSQDGTDSSLAQRARALRKGRT